MACTRVVRVLTDGHVKTMEWTDVCFVGRFSVGNAVRQKLYVVTTIDKPDGTATPEFCFRLYWQKSLPFDHQPLVPSAWLAVTRETAKWMVEELSLRCTRGRIEIYWFMYFRLGSIIEVDTC
ncbi:hypothetical protein CBL_07434 [Carabus blaptoides fortunei]